MPASSRHSRTASPTRSTSVSGAAYGQQQLPNVVKKLAIEGKAERGPDGKGDGASLKMYLKIALPLNSVVPGSTIPLFKEENLKILDSQVHPLDHNSAPFNFSTTTCPLLRKAGSALNLPARLRNSYLSLFDPTAASSSSSSSAAPLEDRYTGHILVSGYHISYVLPKELPSRSAIAGSIGRRATSPEIQFMAAIDMWAPFVTRPPHSPYLLSLPVPKCLSNHIRLRIFPPNSPSISASLASVSSVEGEASSWDLTSDPHVTRSASKRLARSPSYQNFADDDTSDSSTTGFADGYGIQGSFPSTDRMRVRWAAPLKSSDVPETSDGRRRVGIKEVKGDMSCVVLDRVEKGKDRGRDNDEDGEEGIVMKVEYMATCKGVWFPGVATMLGMDVSLDAGDSEVMWAPGEDSKWSVTGGSGFTGFAIGPPPRTSASRQSTADAQPAYILPSTPNGRQDEQSKTNGHKSHVSTSSSSLLRAPLPSQSMDDSAFEDSPTTTPLSSIASLATVPSSPERRRSRASSVSARPDADVEPTEVIRPPKVPISIHLNMNEFVTPQKGVFTFTVSGTILVIPHTNPFLLSHASDNSFTDVSDPLPLPQFHVLSAEKESITTIVRNELDDSALDIFNSTGKLSDPQSRKTVLQPGGQTKCGADGARLAVRLLASPTAFSYRSRRDASVDSVRRPPSRPRTPSSGLQRQASSGALRQTFFTGTPKPKRDGPLMIPRVDAKITPLVSQGSSVPTEYAVCISLPAPSDTDSEWLEFGLAQPSDSLTNAKDVISKHPPANDATKSDSLPPQVQVASASYEGVPVKFETSTIVKPDSKLPALGLTFDETSTKEWMTWVRVHVGDVGAGTMEVVYLVKSDHNASKTPKKKRNQGVSLNVLLPTFSLPVGVMEVLIETQSELGLDSLQHNFTHQQTSSKGRTLTQYSLEQYFYPSLIMTLSTTHKPSSNSSWLYTRALPVLVVCMATIMTALTIVTNHALHAELEQSQRLLDSCSKQLLDLSEVDIDPVTVTTTATVYVTTAIPMALPSSTSEVLPEASLVTSQATPTETVPVPTPSDQSTSTTATTTMMTVTPTILSHPSPTRSPPDDSALLPINDMPFLFPIRFDISALDIPDAARNTAQFVMRGLGVAWHLCRKVYHYPLDPP